MFEQPEVEKVELPLPIVRQLHAIMIRGSISINGTPLACEVSIPIVNELAKSLKNGGQPSMPPGPGE